MKTGICKLCLQEKALCRESHIIPSFHYKFLYGHNNELIYLNSQKAEVRYNSEYESDILCKECEEGVIGRLDDYAAKLIHNKFPIKSIFRLEQINGKECSVLENCPNYDYACFKLFLLSLLWRASITSRPFFKAIQLNSQVEEDLRKMVLNNRPGEPEEFPCFINLPPLVPDQDGRRGFHPLHMPTMSPRCVKKDQLEICEFVIEGMHYYFLVSRPEKWNVIPGVEKNKLITGFASLQDQEQLLQEAVQMMQGE